MEEIRSGHLCGDKQGWRNKGGRGGGYKAF